MNSVVLIGRLTRDPDVRYTTSQMAVARFTLAVDRARGKNSDERGADFISVVCFDRQAEFVEKYFTKGKPMALQGRIQTGSYEKDGRKVYTTDVVAERIEFVDSKSDRSGGGSSYGGNSAPSFDNAPAAPMDDPIPDGFNKLTDDDIPF